MNQLSFLGPTAITVTELTRFLRELLESEDILADLWVQGEVSNLSRPVSGHLYFTLKDSNAALRCVIWRNNVLRQAYLPADGDAVEAHGYISIYETGGQYQLYADLIRPLGEGALYQEFLRLKTRLEAEGLFDPARKREIPQWPQRIGVVTSPTGAAVQDILNTIRRRYPLVEIVLAATPVQGEEAPDSIVAALEALNRSIHPEVILLARGGGSLEDLWAFNDERVARAIAASAAPVITGVGHETDFTIADFVADLRAPTPTAAAELATPDQADLRAANRELSQRLSRVTQVVLNDHRWSLGHLQNRLEIYSPRARVQSERQRLDELNHRAALSVYHFMQLHRAHLHGLELHLASLSPLATLARGYAVVTQIDGGVVYSVTQVQPGEDLNVQVSDGRFGAQVKEKEGEQ